MELVPGDTTPIELVPRTNGTQIEQADFLKAIAQTYCQIFIHSFIIRNSSAFDQPFRGLPQYLRQRVWLRLSLHRASSYRSGRSSTRFSPISSKSRGKSPRCAPDRKDRPPHISICISDFNACGIHKHKATRAGVAKLPLGHGYVSSGGLYHQRRRQPLDLLEHPAMMLP